MKMRYRIKCVILPLKKVNIFKVRTIEHALEQKANNNLKSPTKSAKSKKKFKT